LRQSFRRNEESTKASLRAFHVLKKR